MLHTSTRTRGVRLLAAEELDADWTTIRAGRAPGEKPFANKFLTRGWVARGIDVPEFADGVTDPVFRGRAVYRITDHGRLDDRAFVR